MAVTGWPTDSAAGQVATEDRWIQMARLWAPEGVAPGVAGELAPSFAAGQVTVQPGAAWINGHYAINDTAAVIPVTSDGLVVLRYTLAGSVFALAWVAGASMPTQTVAVYEIPIARMTAGVMTDIRTIGTGSRLNLNVVEPTDQTVTLDTFAAGSPICGLSFIALNKSHWITIYGFVAVTPSVNSQRRLELAWELREGAVIGSGTVISAADGIARSVSVATSLTGNAAQVSASGRWLISGLTVGNPYNVRTMHRLNATGSVTAAILERSIGVE